MKVRTISKLITAKKVNMGGHLIDQPLPMDGLPLVDPFLLLHHWTASVPPNRHPRDLGVGPHPHRGFSPVTLIWKGDIQHRDSLGNNEIIREGGTQWLFSGRGVTHSERPSKEFARSGGEQEFIQFWVNAPAAKKMDSPYYRSLSDEDTPKVQTNGVEIGIVAGSYQGVTSGLPTTSEMLVLRGKAPAGRSFDLEIPVSFQALMYVLEGELTVVEQYIRTKQMAVFNTDGDKVQLSVKGDTRFMVLAGVPLGEDVRSFGPFVMNDQTQIMQALRDAQMGKMGILIEEFD